MTNATQTNKIKKTRLLIANRGEIACRIIRSAKAAGMHTIAIYAPIDRGALHVELADEAHNLGQDQVRESYLNIEKVIEIAKSSGADLIHPGYGFLSESVPFAQAVAEAGIVFVGPTPKQIADLGDKHTARQLAQEAQVPLLRGTGLLDDEAQAVTAALEIGFPVMLKATGGGGGIGLQVCHTPAEVEAAFAQVRSIAERNFDSTGVYLEKLVQRARHLEVQIFGDGTGRVLVVGDRDCSLQRRNQKVIEEAPAFGLPDSVRAQLHDSARRLGQLLSYRSAGTVEFIYDPASQELAFLEVNTRLQVEHPVTEEVFGVDLVAWMLQLAEQGPKSFDDAFFVQRFTPQGCALEARVYAEDPGKNNQPAPGTITEFVLPSPRRDGDVIRVDTGVGVGSEVPPFYDPMIAKLIVRGADRESAIRLLAEAIQKSRISGVVTNLGQLGAIVSMPAFVSGEHFTSSLQEGNDPQPRIDVLFGGTQTTIQDLPGRLGYWQVGVPPSGPFDARSFALANQILGNLPSAPALEITALGPTLKFSHATEICLTGAPVQAKINQQPISQNQVVLVKPFDVLEIPAPKETGLRTYLAVKGGFAAARYLGSAATFTLGRFGGHCGRALQAGDVLRFSGDFVNSASASKTDSDATVPVAGVFTNDWLLRVTEGPHAAPEFFTRADIDELYQNSYEVHHNSARTGVRLIGPKPKWARPDGGQAGLHPSNIHDTPYAIGALDFTGDTPIILGPDGPSLGGFVCPAVVASGDLWKLGQLRPGDKVRFIPVPETQATFQVDTPMLLSSDSAAGTPAKETSVPAIASARASALASLTFRNGDGDDGIYGIVEPSEHTPKVTYRRAGDDNVLIEYGDMLLDLALRMRVQALLELVASQNIPGIIDLTPGIRSLQVHTDPRVLPARKAYEILRELELEVGPDADLVLPSRVVKLPLSWDDPATRLATERYMNGVRSDAPWTPWNIEFIRRINGLESVAEVQKIVYDASYLVLGLGDVYLGAPVATPIDPRHRLVTTKYNPARTWTAENSVGIGGAYMCIYGMEGPGGYQFVGRTVQIWNTYRRRALFQENPWALRFFDQIQWYPVSAAELLDLRADTAAGRANFETVDTEFSLAKYNQFLVENDASIKTFEKQQTQAFEEEKERWRQSGEFDYKSEPMEVSTPEVELPNGAIALVAPFSANVWQVPKKVGDQVSLEDVVIILEAMKMESPLNSPSRGKVLEVYVKPGDLVKSGQVLAAISSE